VSKKNWYKESAGFGSDPFGAGELTDKVRTSPYGHAGGDSNTGVLSSSDGNNHANDYFSESNEPDILEKRLKELREKKLKIKKLKKMKKMKSKTAKVTQEITDDALTIDNFYDEEINSIENILDRSQYDEIDLLGKEQIIKLTNFIQQSVEYLRENYPGSHISILGRMSSFPFLNTALENCEGAQCLGDIDQYCPDSGFNNAVKKLKGVVYRVLSAINTGISEILEDSVDISELATRIIQTENAASSKMKPSYQREYIPGLSKGYSRQLNQAKKYIIKYVTAKNKRIKKESQSVGGVNIPRPVGTPTGNWVQDTFKNLTQDKALPVENSPKKDVIGLADSTTVTIRASGETEGEIGTGFFIGDGVVVTCAHVTNPGGKLASSINVKYNGQEYHASVFAFDDAKDIAVLVVDGKLGNESLTLGDSNNVELGDDIVIYGTPLGFEGVVQEGIISSFPQDYQGSDQQVMFVSAKISPGNSGSAVINVKTNKVVGMAAAIISLSSENSDGLNAAVPVNDIKNFLQENGIKWS